MSSFLSLKDGIRIWTFDISEPQGFSGEEIHLPQFLLLNMAVGGNYTGITDNRNDITATFPAELLSRPPWLPISLAGVGGGGV